MQRQQSGSATRVGSQRQRQQHRPRDAGTPTPAQLLALTGACRARHCACDALPFALHAPHNADAGLPPRYNAPVRPFRPRGRPPALHRRGRSPSIRLRATAPMGRRWDAETRMRRGGSEGRRPGTPRHRSSIPSCATTPATTLKVGPAPPYLPSTPPRSLTTPRPPFAHSQMRWLCDVLRDLRALRGSTMRSSIAAMESVYICEIRVPFAMVRRPPPQSGPDAPRPLRRQKRRPRRGARSTR